jgi:hypothetical protein
MIVGDLFDRYRHGPQPDAKADEQIARLDRVNAFYSEIDRMFVPYMRLDQRLPLWWWTLFATKITDRASSIAVNCARLVKRPGARRGRKT